MSCFSLLFCSFSATGKRKQEDDSDSDDQDLRFSDSESDGTTDSDSDTHEYDRRELGKFDLGVQPVRKSNPRFDKLPKEFQDLVREFDEEVTSIMRPKAREEALHGNSSPQRDNTETHATVAPVWQPHSDQKKRAEDVAKLWRTDDSEQQSNAEDGEKQPNKTASNDDLGFMFDDNIDERNQRAIDAKRDAYLHPSKSAASSSRNAATSKSASDARLDCPGCMTTLCFDSQRHSLYRTQYRAMFVQHCVTDSEKPLKYAAQRNPAGSGKQRKAQAAAVAVSASETGQSEGEEVYFPVRCEVCDTQVGVQDTDEVYHFFNVLAAHC